MTEKRHSPWPWIFLALGIAFFLLVIVVISGVASLFSSVSSSEEATRAVLQTDDNPQGTFVEIPVEGVIVDAAVNGPNPVKWVKTCLDKAAKESDLKGIILRVNSPGGGIRASELILKYLNDFKAKHHVPLVVNMKDVAASGGYYVSMAGDWIVAANETITASIGVIWPYMNWQKLMEDKLGVKFAPLTSAPMKDIASPDRPMTPEEHALIQGFVNDAFQEFIRVAVKGRAGKGKVPVTEKSIRSLQSTFLTGRVAYQKGLVDEIGFHDAAVKKLKALAGIKRAQVIEYQPPKSLLDMLIKAQAERGAVGAELDRIEFLYRNGPGVMALWTR